MRMGHVMETPNPDDHLLERILCRENLLSAWKQVKQNHGAPGIDGMTIEEFPAFTRDH
jgi:RNA-directed DNA polymerase